MKIAIMGAGLSGLACAIMLEKHGLKADVFEKRADVGDRFIVAEAMFSMLYHPVDDPVKMLSEEYGIDLRPTTNIKKMYVCSKHESACLNGHFGFVNMRGKHPEAYERQLKEQYNGSIHFQKEVTYKELAKDYSHIVLATGDPGYTEEIQQFDTALKATFKGAIVKGNFEGTTVYTWFNNEYAPQGMGYFLPHSEEEGSLVLVYPMYEQNQHLDKGDLWRRFKEAAEVTLNQSLPIKDEFSITDYVVGKSAYPRIGNTSFVGNYFGAISPLFGFGQFESIMTGIYAAMDLAGQGDYEKLTSSLYQNYHDSLTLRRAMEQLNNDQYDLVTKSLHLKTVQRVLNNRRVNPFKLLGRTLRPFTRES